MLYILLQFATFSDVVLAVLIRSRIDDRISYELLEYDSLLVFIGRKMMFSNDLFMTYLKWSIKCVEINKICRLMCFTFAHDGPKKSHF